MSDNKIKVAFFAEILIKDFDGASRTMYHLIDRIPNQEFDYLFFCGTEPDHDVNHEIVKIPALTIPFNASYKAAVPALAKGKLLKKLKEYNPDVIHIASPSPLGNFAAEYGQKHNIPVFTIYHTHFISYMQYYFRSLPMLIKPAENYVANGYRKFYNKADVVYVPTQQMINELVDLNIDEHRLKLWQRGMNHSLFNPTKKDTAFLNDLTGNEKPTIIYASRLVWEKNVKTLIDIYQEAQKQGKDWNWVIAGNGVAMETAQEKMPKAHFLGHVNHDTLSKLYATSDVFVFPSISETYGNVVVEAMASGCIPVIARGGGSQSLVKDKVTGYLCEPNDANDYIQNIEKALSDDKDRKAMQEAGYVYTSKLDWDVLADTYFNQIKDLAKA